MVYYGRMHKIQSVEHRSNAPITEELGIEQKNGLTQMIKRRYLLFFDHVISRNVLERIITQCGSESEKRIVS